MENYLLNFVILIVPAIILWRSSTMAKKTNNPPLMNAVKDENTAITPSSSSYQRETNLIDLPFDIIIDILNRLSMKSLRQFPSVCKSWRTLFSTREIAIQINQISDTKYSLMIDDGDWRSRDSGIRRFKIPIELQSLDFMLMKPINGILCIIGPITSHVTWVYLWNPLTNEFKHLPKPNVQMGYVSVGFGFGFAPNCNDYKVVRVIQHERNFDSRVEIYSLNRGSWRRAKYDPSLSSSEINGNERCRFRNGVVTVDLEKEVITKAEPRYNVYHRKPEEDHNRRKYCTTSAWSDDREAIMLTLPENDLILNKRIDEDRYSYRSSTRFEFSWSLVSLSRHHDDLR